LPNGPEDHRPDEINFINSSSVSGDVN
jgi:hypothetical protein